MRLSVAELPIDDRDTPTRTVWVNPGQIETVVEYVTWHQLNPILWLEVTLAGGTVLYNLVGAAEPAGPVLLQREVRRCSQYVFRWLLLRPGDRWREASQPALVARTYHVERIGQPPENSAASGESQWVRAAWRASNDRITVSLPHLQVAFWTNPLTTGERAIIYYSLVIAGIALFAMFVKIWTSRSEIGSRYRPAIFAGLAVTGVAFLSYVVLVVKFDLGYTKVGGTATGAGSMWMPNENAIWSWAPRYMDWSITVPLLVAELVAVSALVGLAATRIRTIGMITAFLMIFTGYLGGVVLGDGNSLAGLWTWGIISGVFMVILYVVFIFVLTKSTGKMSTESARTMRLAVTLQLVVFFAYPIIFGFQGYTAKDGAWTVAAQVTLSLADIAAKVGFGSLIHKLAKLRTAEDIAKGEETHPESVWVSGAWKADAVLPPLKDGTGSRHSAEARRREPVVADGIETPHS